MWTFPDHSHDVDQTGASDLLRLDVEGQAPAERVAGGPVRRAAMVSLTTPPADPPGSRHRDSRPPALQRDAERLEVAGAGRRAFASRHRRAGRSRPALDAKGEDGVAVERQGIDQPGLLDPGQGPRTTPAAAA